MSDMCEVCGQPLDEYNVSRCMVCGGRFHMTWSVDSGVGNCGRVWFDPRSNGIAFVCNPCLSENPVLNESLIDSDTPTS